MTHKIKLQEQKWCIYCNWYLDDEHMCINSESRHYLDFVAEYHCCDKFKNAYMEVKNNAE